MVCKHERLKSVNCVLFCDVCGAKLPADFLKGKDTAPAQKAAETPVKAEKTEAKKPTRKKVAK